jgi:hypothetical protein
MEVMLKINNGTGDYNIEINVILQSYSSVNLYLEKQVPIHFPLQHMCCLSIKKPAIVPIISSFPFS